LFRPFEIEIGQEEIGRNALQRVVDRLHIGIINNIPKQQAEQYNDSVKEGSLLVLVDKEDSDHDGNPKAPLTGMIL